MRSKLFCAMVAGTAIAFVGLAGAGAQQADSGQGQVSGGGGRWRGAGGFPGGGRGVLGTVTEVAADHYTIKTDAGEVYTVHYSVNTRMMKQVPGQGGGRGRMGSGAGSGSGSGAGSGAGASEEARPAPQTIKPSDIKVGDVITAAGEVDAANKSIGAVYIAQVDPESAKRMREMQANFGKTWLAGRITAIDGVNITIEGMLDHTSHTIAVDENTSFRQRRDSITLADIKPGEQLRAEGAMKAGIFLATQVNAMEPQPREGGRDQTPGAAPKPQ